MFKIHPEIPESMSLEAKAFILRCFEPDPDRRATAWDLLTDEFLTVTSRKKRSKGSFTGGHGGAARQLTLNPPREPVAELEPRCLAPVDGPLTRFSCLPCSSVARFR